MILETLPLIVLAMVAASADDVEGHYYLEGVREVGSELLLSPGGKFQYMLAYGAADYHAEGSWRRDGDFVVLKTDGKEEPPFKLIKSETTKTPGVRVWLKASNGRAVPNIDVILLTGTQTGEDVLRGRTDLDGVALFGEVREAKAVRFSVRVYQLEAGPYPVTASHNELHFEINGESITRVLFKDERLPIEGKSLVMRFWNKDQVMRYVKQGQE